MGGRRRRREDARVWEELVHGVRPLRDGLLKLRTTHQEIATPLALDSGTPHRKNQPGLAEARERVRVDHAGQDACIKHEHGESARRQQRPRSRGLAPLHRAARALRRDFFGVRPVCESAAADGGPSGGNIAERVASSVRPAACFSRARR